MWTYDPVEPPVFVTCYQRKLAVPSQRWRWRARAVNGRKIANGGEGYSSRDDLVGALELLWPPATTSHIVVRWP